MKAENILIVAATPREISDGRIKKTGGRDFFKLNGFDFPLLITGIGMVNTALNLGKFFSEQKPEFAINIGVCGSFGQKLKKGEVVEVREDCFADLGSESGSGFLGLKEMGFSNFSVDDKVYYNCLENPDRLQSGLEVVKGITVNKVHGVAGSIEEALELWGPDIETMESAAFFQACIMNEIPFLAVRSVSNYVEPRSKQDWEIELAVKNLDERLSALLFELIK